jgi:hypothetical protein
VASVLVKRQGDLTSSLSIRCYTRSRSASAGQDFIERPANSDASLIVFEPNESEKICNVTIIDDAFHEGEELFRLILVDVSSDLNSDVVPVIGPVADVLVTIVDPEDGIFNNISFSVIFINM